MAQTMNQPLPRRLTIEELRKYSGNENLSDEELEQQSLFLLEFSIVLYKVYQKLEIESNILEQSIIQKSPEVKEKAVILAKVG